MNKKILEKFNKYFDRVLIYDAITESEFTYGAILSKAVAIANQLNLEGVDKGKKVGVILRNSIEIIAVYFATLLAGTIVVPLNPNYSQNDFECVINQAQLDVIISTEEYFEKISKFFFKKEPLTFDVNTILSGENLAAELNFQLPKIEWEDVIGVLFTSGSTGRAKGVVMKYGAVFEALEQYGHDMRFNEKTRFMQVVPFFHAHGWFYSSIVPALFGASVAITEPFNDDVCSRFWDVVQKYNANVMICMPFILTSILNRKQRSIEEPRGKLDYVICGSAFLHHNLKIEFEKTFHTAIYEFYGSTETLYVAYQSPSIKNKIGTVGKLFPKNCTVKVAKDGELLVKTKYAFKEYFDENKLTEDVIKGDYIKTGDLGSVDKSGYISLLGRKKEIIKKEGYHVSPVEVSNYLMTHEAINEAAAVGLKDLIYGEEICSFVVLKDKELISEEDLLIYFKHKLSKIVCPKRIIILKEIPKNAVGKIDTFELTKIAKLELTENS